VDPTALYPFGHGLSYAPVTWAEVSSSGEAWPTDGSCEVTVALQNPHDRSTTEVVQVYLHDTQAEVVRPVQQLIAYARVELDAGEARTVSFSLHADLTSFTGLAGRRIVEPGVVELRVGASSRDVRATVKVELVGPRREVGFDRVRTPVVS
jgi:beta-glucosidase